MNGLEKEIDPLGRIVIPMDFKRKLGLKKNDKVIVSLSGNHIIISPSGFRCLICGASAAGDKNVSLCFNCIKKIKEL